MLSHCIAAFCVIETRHYSLKVKAIRRNSIASSAAILLLTLACVTPGYSSQDLPCITSISGSGQIVADSNQVFQETVTYDYPFKSDTQISIYVLSVDSQTNWSDVLYSDDVLPAGSTQGKLTLYAVTDFPPGGDLKQFSANGCNGAVMGGQLKILPMTSHTFLSKTNFKQNGETGQASTVYDVPLRAPSSVNFSSDPEGAILFFDVMDGQWKSNGVAPPSTTGGTVQMMANFPAGVNVAYVNGIKVTLNDSAANPADLGSCDCEAMVGAPINVSNGNTYVKQQDYSIPGLNGGLQVVRTWNSLWPSAESVAVAGIFGHSWQSNLEQRIVINNDNTAEYWRPDGSRWYFNYVAISQTYVLSTPANQSGILLQVDSNANRATLILRDGSRKLFSLVGGHLLAEVDRNGNSTSYVYDSGNRLSIVIDPAGRRLFLNYADSRFPFQVTNINSDAGISTFYSYDTAGRLIQVRRADASTLNFEYDANSLLTAVKDTQGKVIESHTYDSTRRGLTSSRANGVQAVSVSYPN